jgi:hypothetical protein
VEVLQLNCSGILKCHHDEAALGVARCAHIKVEPAELAVFGKGHHTNSV